jgi:hypothetical protein
LRALSEKAQAYYERDDADRPILQIEGGHVEIDADGPGKHMLALDGDTDALGPLKRALARNKAEMKEVRATVARLKEHLENPTATRRRESRNCKSKSTR